MVRQATETAVSASISTPVRPVVRTSAVTARPGSDSSGSTLTATAVSGSGWQSGMRSPVRFAAIVPASSAIRATSPFAAPPEQDEGQRRLVHPHQPARRREALGLGLGRDVDHARAAVLVEMGEIAAISALQAAA